MANLMKVHPELRRQVNYYGSNYAQILAWWKYLIDKELINEWEVMFLSNENANRIIDSIDANPRYQSYGGAAQLKATIYNIRKTINSDLQELM